MNPFERHDAITHALLERVDKSPVRMLSRPYLAACLGELAVDAEPLATWTAMVNANVEQIGALIEEYPPIDSDVGHRFVAALLYAIERDTRGLPEAPAQVRGLLFGSLELDAVLREIGEPR